jgi:hypothetical protein
VTPLGSELNRQKTVDRANVAIRLAMSEDAIMGQMNNPLFKGVKKRQYAEKHAVALEFIYTGKTCGFISRL